MKNVMTTTTAKENIKQYENEISFERVRRKKTLKRLSSFQIRNRLSWAFLEE